MQTQPAQRCLGFVIRALLLTSLCLHWWGYEHIASQHMAEMAESELAVAPDFQPSPGGMMPQAKRTRFHPPWDDLSLIREVETVRVPLDRLYEDMLEHYGSFAHISCRTKSVASLGYKLKQGMQEREYYSLMDVKDLAGIRLVFDDLRSLYTVAEQIERRYDIDRKKDYIQEPKEDGYRSLHYNIVFDSILVEIQLRTEAMDRWAQWSHDLLYKNSGMVAGVVGEERFEEFRLYARQLSDYSYQLEKGVARPAPKLPQDLQVLWDYAPGPVRRVMRSNGAPDLVPVRPLIAGD
ncbi:MAG: hypothetical protein KDK78_10600 [Chlamydiia bacterium]|nr:hypothetical protein [Chlamydiia bacterium]